ncbi:MAG TPA: hypothetical protein VMR70_12995, partial [Flavisolibacter sp.]|nr:hypothetical protein [Flavisolibacter sp.]
SGQHDFLGATAEKILKRVYETVFIYKPVQPLNTLRRMVVVIPAKAELEPGFGHWYARLTTVAKEAGISIAFYGTQSVIKELEDLQSLSKAAVKSSYHVFTNWDDFLIFSRELKENDLFVIIASRKGHLSYQPAQDKLSYYLTNYFKENSFLLLYPKQLEQGIKMDEIAHADGALAETIVEGVSSVNKVGSYLRNIFRKKEG